jgi:undecaprenyl-diphosphatase
MKTSLLAFATATAVFVLLAADVADDRGWVVDVDEAVAGELHEVFDDRPVAVDVLNVVTFFGSSAALYPFVGVVAVYALANRRPKLAVLVVVAAVSGALLNRIVKTVIGRDRPSFPDPIEVGGGPALPSGHAMNSAIAFGAAVLVAWMVHRHRARVAAFIASVAAIAIGFTRVALGVHFLSDVVGGWLLAIAWLNITAIAAQTHVIRSRTFFGAPRLTSGRRSGSRGRP